MITLKGSPTLGLVLLGVLPRLLASSNSGAGAGLLCFGWLCCMIFLVAFPIAGLYKTFEKAGQPGWHAIIPILNGAVVAHLVGRDWWWGVIPYLNLVPMFELAKAFGKESIYGLGIIFLPFIFLPMLGFGDAQFQLERRPPLF